MLCVHVQVPIALYFMTHAYFCFYHTLANVCLRRTRNAVAPGLGRLLAMGTVVVLLSYATAFMETATISHFPYYSFKVRHTPPQSAETQPSTLGPVELSRHFQSWFAPTPLWLSAANSAARTTCDENGDPSAPQDKGAMYSVGSLFYAIYFFVSFPMYFRLDEWPRHKWTAGQAAVDSLAASMLVTILLDLWRLFVGSVWEGDSSGSGPPWLHQTQ
jgi:hypothetical protein